MKKILILTAEFDDGNHAAARSLRDAIESLDENAFVEVLDLFADNFGVFNTIARKLWCGFHSLLGSPLVDQQAGGFSRLQTTLKRILAETQPDCVVSTYPVYGHVLKTIFHDRERPFKFITIITDSFNFNPIWFRAPSDYFCVANAASADALVKGGIAEKQILTLGYPVNPVFTENPGALVRPAGNEPRRVLFIVNTRRKKAAKAVVRLMEIENLQLTVVAGHDSELRARLIECTRDFGDRVKVLGWTNQMPEHLMSHHLVISKAGSETVHDAIAACCPIIVNKVISGQHEGNAALIEKFNLGTVVDRNREIAEAVELAFGKQAVLWNEWRKNLKKLSRPDAALRIGELVLESAGHELPDRKAVKLFETTPDRLMRAPAHTNGSDPRQMLLCDFHIHSNYSDGKLSVPEIIDFYGERGFDCICITDHLADPKHLLGKIVELANCTLPQDQVGEYFAVVERERQRAWRRYKMLVMTGIEFNKDGYTAKTSAHLLGIDLKSPISAALDIPDIIEQIHHQGGLAVASHPHIMKSEWGKNTLYLWENQDKFAPLLDAWEIANRDNIFNDIGLKRLPFIANSDFHKPKHIYSWKTLIYARKDAEAIKDCICRNEHVSITLYRDFTGAAAKQKNHGFDSLASLHKLPDHLPLHAVNR
jgi:processive 1,2-diacylglycerol beta-glucosyltransferase